MTPVDEAAAEALLAKLIQWGLLEERPDGDIGPTRRWNAKVQAGAERLNQDVEKTGTYPEGNPLVLAIAAALDAERSGIPDHQRDDLIRILVTMELTRMSADKRARYGFDLAL